MCPTDSITPSVNSMEKPDHKNTQRRLANFHPSIWGDQFLYCTYDSKAMNETIRKIEKLKEEVKRMLIDPMQIHSEKLQLIDSIQRLGVSYHFQKEIENILEEIYHSTKDKGPNKEMTGDLRSVSLWFRLLRQQGYSISSDVFNKFELKEIVFKDSDACNVEELLSLYEATHLRRHGEDILDEAHASVVACLEALVPSLKPFLKTQVNHALKYSLHQGLPRVEARHFFSIYEDDHSHNETLLTFAKLDFNHLQKVHQQELSDITRWWKDLDFKNKLPFARDRVVECYFWILAVYFEPEYLLARKFTTKVIAMISIIDDLYDVFGTIEELQLFTEAVERWETDATDTLPEYMQHIFQALLTVYREMEDAIGPEGKSYRLDYAIEAMKTQVRAYFEEAKWFDQKYVPTIEEYMVIAVTTAGYSTLMIASLVGMGDIVTEEAFQWISSNPKIIKASCVICRLLDDIVSHEFEQKRGHVPSAVECYTIQHGVTKEEAVDVFREEISNGWKDINESYARPTPVPMQILDRFLNMTRAMDFIYKDEDGYTLAEIVLKDYITSLFIEPVQIQTSN